MDPAVVYEFDCYLVRSQRIKECLARLMLGIFIDEALSRDI